MYGIYESGNVIARFVAPVTVQSNRPVFLTDTLSLSRKVAKRPVQRWEIITRLEPLSFSAQDLFVNIATKGYSETVFVIVPQNYGAVQAKTETGGTVSITGTQGESLATLNNVTNLIPKGTFFKITGHNKVYITTSDRDGSGSVGVFPELLDTFAGTTIQYQDDVIMSCLYDTDTVSGMTYTDGILMDVGTVKMVERL